MSKHREILLKIKSDLLNLCICEQNSKSSYDRQIHFFLNVLKKYFAIEKSCFLLYEGKTIKPNRVISSLEIDIDQITWVNLDDYFGQNKLMHLAESSLCQLEFEHFSHLFFLKWDFPNKHGVILFQTTNDWTSFSTSESFNEFIDIFSSTLKMISTSIEIKQNEAQYRKLYNMSDLFHSTMDIDVILKNVLISIQENFPNFGVELILSNDQERHTNIEIKPFDYLTERASAIEAFVSGEMTMEQASDLNKSLLNAPIKGRQGIYGILQVSIEYGHPFTDTEQNFIAMLAQVSGNALENAKLYHQSHRLISDLQLINETSHRLNMKLNIDEMFLYLQKQLMRSFKPLELCFVMIENENIKLTETSTKFFNSEEGYRYLQYVKMHFANSQEPIFIADLSKILGTEIEYKSIMAIPMIVEQKITGFSIVLHRDSYFFSFDSFKLMQSLIHHSSLAIANSILRNQLQQMVDYDHLTTLYARSYLDKFVENSLRKDRSGMFMLLDIDDFKMVNDTFGHQIGDEVLVQIGEQLKNIINTRGICARWGGEELAIYVPNMLEDEAFKLAKLIVESIPKVTNPSVSVSAGLVNWNSAQVSKFQSLFLQADTALYYAKEKGKNQVCVYEESMFLQS